MVWIVTILLGMVIGGGSIYLFFKKTSNNMITDAKKASEKLIVNAKNEATTLKKEKLIEAQEEIFEQKQSLEKAYEQKRSKIQRLEKLLDQKEVDVDRKSDIVEKREKGISHKERQLKEQESEARQKKDELNRLISQQLQKLEEISQLSSEEAKALLLKNMEKEAREEGIRITHGILEKSRLEARRKAREIVVQAIQQIAAEQSVEATVSVITLPNDDMKGRIIGREGRNIRSFELTTGVDVIIDDTPEVVVLSSYNSYRREIAQKSLEKLISDGRIHPARIEEVVEKTTEEMRETLREIGEQTLMEVGVHGVTGDLAEMLGKLKYRTSYGQNVLNHSIEVAHLCGIMAAELGMDVRLAKRAGIFHDIGKAADSFTESNHTSLGADVLKKFNENQIVINASEAHHEDEDVEACFPITLLVRAADVISGKRPGARRESLESFINRMQNLEEIANAFEGVEKSYAIQAGREVRVIVETEKVEDSHARELAREIAQKIQMEIEFPGPIKVTVIREYRSFDYAT